MITAQFIEKKRYRNHAKYKIRYHIIFTTKYRKHLISPHIEELIKMSCRRTEDMYKNFEIEIMEIDLQLKNHIHFLIKSSPQITTYDIWHTDDTTTKYMRKFYWKQHHLWSKGYFCSSIGDACTETIKNYIESQG